MKKILSLALLLGFWTGSVFCESSDVLKKSSEMINNKQYKEAVDTLEEVVQKHKDLYEAYYLLGKAYYCLDQAGKAEENLSLSLKLNDKFVPAMLLVVNIYCKSGRNAEAESLVNQAINLEPLFVLLHVKLADIYEAENKLDESIREYMKSYDLDKFQVESVLKAANIYYKKKNYQPALGLLNVAWKDLSTNSELSGPARKMSDDCRFNLLVIDGEKYFNTGKIIEALKKYQDAYQINPSNSDVGVKIANCHVLQKHIPQALQCIDDVIAKDGKSGPAYRLKAGIFYNQKKFTEAGSNILKAIEFEGGNSKNYLLAGKIHEMLGLADRAEKYYYQAVLLNDSEGEAHFRLGFLLADANKFEESIRHLESASSTMVENEEAKLLLAKVKALNFAEEGNRNFDEKKFKDAVQNYDKSLALEKNVLVQINKANALIELSEFNEAIPILKAVVNGKEKFVPAYDSLVTAYQKIGNIKEAEKTLKLLQAIGDKNWEINYHTGMFYEQNMDYQKAEKSYLKAKETAPNKEALTSINRHLLKTWFNQGVSLYNSAQYEDSEKYFLKVQDAEPGNKNVKLALERIKTMKDINQINRLIDQGNSSYASGNYLAAIDSYQKLLEVKDDSKIKYNLAMCYYNIKNSIQAKLLFKEYLEQNPRDTEAIYLLGQIYVDSGDNPGAKMLMIKSCERGNENDKLYYFLGTLYEKENNLKDAIVNYSKALELNPQNLEANINLGSIYYWQKEYTKSQDLYEKIVQLQPNNDVAIYNLGIIYFKKNRLNDAINQFQKAESLLGSYAPLYFNIARTYYYLGSYDQAQKYAEMARRAEDTNNIVYKWGLANIYIKLSQTLQEQKKVDDFRQKARVLCEDCVAFDKNPEISAQARRRILEIIPEKKYLYKVSYAASKKFIPQIIENSIYYFSENSGELIKAYKESGETIWKVKMSSDPCGQYKIGQDVFCPLADGTIIALDTEKGQLQYKINSSAQNLSPFADGVLILSANGNELSFFKDSKAEWNYTLPLVDKNPNSFDVEGQNIYFYNQKILVALDKSDGHKLWEFTTDAGERIDRIHAYKDVVLVEGMKSSKFITASLNSKDGKALWMVKMKDKPIGKPICSYNNIIFCLADNTLTCYSLEGKVQWTKKMDDQIIAVTGQKDALYIATKNYSFYCWDTDSGKEKWKHSIDKSRVKPGEYYSLYFAE